jgi:hypothetical protein
VSEAWGEGMTKFKMDKHTRADKSFAIYNDDIMLIVDFDDVNHLEVEKAAKLVLDILNIYYPRKSRKDFKDRPMPVTPQDYGW